MSHHAPSAAILAGGRATRFGGRDKSTLIVDGRPILEQQMAAIGRALMANPTLLLCDELSLGLAPIVIKEIYGNFRAIVADGMSAVIVEQDIAQALKLADFAYCMLEGRVALKGPTKSLTREAIAAAYFGV